LDSGFRQIGRARIDPLRAPRMAAVSNCSMRSAAVIPAKPTLTSAAPAAANVAAICSMPASSAASPIAAVTMRVPATQAQMSRNTSADQAPRAPVDGSFASITSAPPASAAAASAAVETLTSNCIRLDDRDAGRSGSNFADHRGAMEAVGLKNLQHVVDRIRGARDQQSAACLRIGQQRALDL